MAVVHSDEFRPIDLDSGRELVRVMQNMPGYNSAGTSAGTFPHYFYNFLPHSRLEVEPVVGFEPTTDGLQNRCSTTELNWLNYDHDPWIV